MALSKIFGTLKAMVVPSSRDLAAPPGAPAPATLAMEMPGQEQTNWCWAAVAYAVSDFYNAAPESQCALAGEVLSVQPGKACCDNGASSQCNKQWFLHKALQAVDCFHDLVPRPAGTIPLTQVQAELAAKQPLGVRVEWSEGSAQGGGHFVAISAWQRGASGAAYVTVEDPWGPATEKLPIDDMADAYGTDKGVWTHSYLTLPPHLAKQIGGATAAIPPTADLLGG